MDNNGRIVKIYMCNVAESYGTVNMCDGKEFTIVGPQGGVFLNWILVDDVAHMGGSEEFCKSIRCRNTYRKALLKGES